MKKLLIIYPDVSANPGINKKLVQKLKCLHDQGKLKLSLIIFGKDADQKMLDEFSFIPSTYVNIPKYSGSWLEKRSWNWRKLNKKKKTVQFQTIQDTVTKMEFDLIFMRDYRASEPGLRFIENLSELAPLVLELNTNLELETKMIWEKDTSKDWNRIEFENERDFKPKQLGFANGVVAVTSELLDQYGSFLQPGAKQLVLSNGTNPNELEVAAMPSSSGIVRLLFLAGAGNSAYKIDRLIRALKQYKGTQKVELLIVGMEGQSWDSEHALITYHDRCFGAELNKLCNEVHAGISTLGLYQKGLSEASTLKVREYLGRGLPIVLGYKDTDVHEDFEFAYRVSNDATPIEVGAMVQWVVERYQTQPDLRAQIRKYALENLSYDVKMRTLGEWLEKV